MAVANGSLLQTHLPNSTLSQLFASLDPKSLILSQFPTNDEKPNFFQLTTEGFLMERGPRYNAYAKLRESRLLIRSQSIEPEIGLDSTTSTKQGKFQGTPMRSQFRQPEIELNLTPPQKQGKFQGTTMRSQFQEPEMELKSPLKKQRKFPVTPPSGGKGCSVLAQSVPDFVAMVRKENRKPTSVLPPAPMKTPESSKGPRLFGVGAKSVNSGEKRSGGATGRKSYSTMEELKGFGMNGGERGRGGSRCKTVLGYKEY